jgi:hypothetical protein
MCGDPPTPPSGSLPGGAPTGPSSGTGLCCACPANGDVNTNGVGNYVVSGHSPTTVRTNKCKIAIVRTEDGGTVTVKKSFGLTYSQGANEAANKATVSGAITSAMSAWQAGAAPYRIVVEQPGCQKQKLKIQFTAVIVASAGDVAVDVDGRPAAPPGTPGHRSGVSGGDKMHFYLNGVGDVAWTMTHETGHTFGLADEYTFDRPTNTAPTMTYKGASDPDVSVTLSPSPIPFAKPGFFGFDNLTIMGRNGNNTFPSYLFFWIAIEVKKIFAAAGISAVVKVETA